jgi:hypothetical protein
LLPQGFFRLSISTVFRAVGKCFKRFYPCLVAYSRLQPTLHQPRCILQQ